MKIDALNHPKTIQLSVHLSTCTKTCIPQAIGHLELLWAFVAQKTPRGNVGRWSNAVIAHAVMWDGDADDFVKALIDSGFVDESDEHRLLIHDWSEHCPNWVRAKLKREGKGFISEDLRKDLSPRLTGDYKPSQAKPRNKHMSDSDESDVRFENIWKARAKSKNESKARAKKAYAARVRKGTSHADLLAGVERYAACCKAEGTESRFIKHLATFLGPDEFWKLPYKIAGKVPTDLASVRRLVAEKNIDIPDNSNLFEARKIISQATGMHL